VTGLDGFTRAREGDAGGLDRKRLRLTGQALVFGELVHGWQVAELHLGQV
jgi:hypothetical protein